jgi:F-type H+-transporting ATPase subunit b
MANENTSGGLPPIVKVVLGFAIAAVGVFLNEKIGAGTEHVGRIELAGVALEPGKTVGALGVFLALFPVIESFFVKPLTTALGERNDSLESTFAEVESLRSEMTSMKSEYEKRIASTEAEAREKINAQIKEAQVLRQSLMAEAADKSDALIKQAQEEISGEKSKALREIQIHVTDLALQAAEKVVGKNLDNDLNRKLIADFVSDLEVKK